MIVLLFWICLIQTLSASLQQDEISPFKNDIGGRIVGGRIATRGQFPFLAAIETRTSTSSYFCGGSLLTSQWVLTAGHCVEGAVLFTVHLGSTSLADTDPYLVKVSTDSYLLHPDYNSSTLQNDIGLIEFRIPITFTDYIKPINRIPGAPLSDNSPVITMGWGQVSDSNPDIQSKVHFITVTTFSNDDCKLYYGNQIVDSMVCAATNYNGGNCYGDTGGPLIQYISRLQVMVVGVASFISQNGCESPEPSGFTRVFNYIDWITNNTGFSN